MCNRIQQQWEFMKQQALYAVVRRPKKMCQNPNFVQTTRFEQRTRHYCPKINSVQTQARYLEFLCKQVDFSFDQNQKTQPNLYYHSRYFLSCSWYAFGTAFKLHCFVLQGATDHDFPIKLLVKHGDEITVDQYSERSKITSTNTYTALRPSKKVFRNANRLTCTHLLDRTLWTAHHFSRLGSLVTVIFKYNKPSSKAYLHLRKTYTCEMSNYYQKKHVTHYLLSTMLFLEALNDFQFYLSNVWRKSQQWLCSM